MKIRRTPLALVAAVAMVATAAHAADHAEAPITGKDAAADITDFYAWHNGANINAVVAFAPLIPAGGSAVYDSDVLYGIHIDNDDDNLSDIDVWIRFGQDGSGNWGVQVENLPGGDAVVMGAVETALDAGNGLQAWAGLADDPFFFDQVGFIDTLYSGTLSFTGSDTLAGSNITAIVVTMDAATAHAGTNTVHMWATSARL